MLIVMHRKATQKQVGAVLAAIERMGLIASPIPGSERTAIGVLGNRGYVEDVNIRDLPGVKDILHVSKPYKMVSRDFHPRATIIKVGSVEIGEGRPPVIIAGPCAVESEEQIIKTAKAVKAAGAEFLRGGAFKPRTGPHTFQGLKEEGLKLLVLAKQETGLPVVTEVMTSENVALVARYADILQVGARNMQNFDLLRELGRIRKPVLLKRGMSATIEEFLAAAEYILAEGKSQRHSLRAGHPDIRDSHPQQPGSDGCSHHKGTVPSPYYGGPVPCNREKSAGTAHGQSGPHGRRPWHHG